MVASPAAQRIHFIPLTRDHFVLLHRWLEEPHVKEWWDKNVLWTDKLIEEKYDTYVDSYKIVGDTQKPLHAFIVLFDDVPIGYIQYYNAYDFPCDERSTLEGLPQPLAAIDLYIGDPHFIGKGFGPRLIDEFLKRHVWSDFAACFVDPDSTNLSAVLAYKKAGFKIIKTIQDRNITWMLKKRTDISQ
jgi:RimJ/RimL family protein N-acetyltransferase